MRNALCEADIGHTQAFVVLLVAGGEWRRLTFSVNLREAGET